MDSILMNLEEVFLPYTRRYDLCMLLHDQSLFFFSTFLARNELNWSHVKCCFPFPAMVWIAYWTWSSVRFSFNIFAIFFNELKVMRPSPYRSISWKAWCLPYSVWGWPFIMKKIQSHQLALSKIAQIQPIRLQEPRPCSQEHNI